MLVICDVDGTVCTGCQPLSNEMVGQLRALAINHCLVFISGTDAIELRRMITEPLNCDHWVLAEYGAYGYSCIGNFFSTYQGCPAVLDEPSREKIVVALIASLAQFKIMPQTGDYILDRACQVTLSCLGRSAATEEKAAFDPFGAIRSAMAAWIRDKIGNNYFIQIGGTTSIDVGYVDKREGIRRFLSRQDNKDAVFIGDSFGPTGNDASVLGLLPCFVVRSPGDFGQVAGLINRL